MKLLMLLLVSRRIDENFYFKYQKYRQCQVKITFFHIEDLFKISSFVFIISTLVCQKRNERWNVRK